EALIHGLCEVIERDAVSQFLFCEFFGDPGDGPPGRRIDPGTLPASTEGPLLAAANGDRQVLIDDLTLDVAIPVFRAMIADPGYPSLQGPELRVFVGYGCDPNAEVAVARAISEASQSVVAVAQGARDSFNDVTLPRRSATLAAIHNTLEPATLHDFRSVPSFAAWDLRADLDHILSCLVSAGFETALAFDLTHPDLRVPVVRVRVPGMACFVIDRNRIGARCLRWLA
ncbi:MAG: YcaO-like family protein, partial [Pseudomonadota bacterium]